ncbi:transposase [Erysipelothrix amsterdamensis]|uniref:Transposase n=1 Tax=Erysipelothrix amsterdamensis TaxID=2929157 RepID=A0AAU9VH06_9FIRM|nr:transposase [Erysipelothrix sp. A18Y020d]CAH2762044.1 transposase [Erysipelothrix sp. A18Y020d]
MTRRKRREYTQDFKRQMVQLYHNGKALSEIIQEYGLTASTFHKWITQDANSGSFKENDNLTVEQKNN